MRIHTNDTVKVIAGEDRGVIGKVLRVDRQQRKVVVEGVNRVYKHVRRDRRNPQGGRLSKEMPISVSNVQLICEACGKATRVGVRFLPDGSKERYCKRCGSSCGLMSPPKARRAKQSNNP